MAADDLGGGRQEVDGVEFEGRDNKDLGYELTGPDYDIELPYGVGDKGALGRRGLNLHCKLGPHD